MSQCRDHRQAERDAVRERPADPAANFGGQWWSNYDAVHLQAAAYLAAAGTAIPVDADTASVIAGWGPNETYWFTPRIQRLDESTAWILDERGADRLWVRGGRPMRL